VLAKLLHHLSHLLELLLLLFLASILHGVAEIFLHLLAFVLTSAFVHEFLHHAHETATAAITTAATSATTPSVETSTTMILAFGVLVVKAKVRQAVSFVLSCSLILLLLSVVMTLELIHEFIKGWLVCVSMLRLIGRCRS